MDWSVDLLNGHNSANKSIKTSMLRSDLFNYSDAYIVVTGKIDLKTCVNDDMLRKDAGFKNNALFSL